MVTSRTATSKKIATQTASSTPASKPLAKKTVAAKPAPKTAAKKVAATPVKKTAATPVKKAVATPVKKTSATPAKKANVPKAKETAVATGSPPPKTANKSTVSPEERYHMIATAAYFLAEKHGFNSCYAMRDWIVAEAEIDAKLNTKK